MEVGIAAVVSSHRLAFLAKHVSIAVLPLLKCACRGFGTAALLGTGGMCGRFTKSWKNPVIAMGMGYGVRASWSSPPWVTIDVPVDRQLYKTLNLLSIPVSNFLSAIFTLHSINSKAIIGHEGLLDQV